MAVSSYAMQSILASPMTRTPSRSRVNQFGVPALYMPNMRRNASLSVRSMAEEEQKEQSTEPISPVTPPKPQPRSPKMSTKFSDVLAFSGPAPERINGRLAMIGFVAALAVELSNGQDLLSQISNGGIPWFLGTSVVLSLASLIPLFQGVSVESKSGGFMSSDAELWNGRFAMLGLIALAFTDDVMEANKLKGGKLDAWDILKQIQKLVAKRGEGQVNRSKHSEYDDGDGYESEGQDDREDDVEGFDEVTDTVVRERIMESIESEIEEYNNQNGFTDDSNKRDDDNDEKDKDYNDDEEEDDDDDEKEESESKEDFHKRKRSDEIGDDLENSKPSKIVKKLLL